ncbi:MAG: DUF4397 domain-containing protein [Chitinophagales bacterium]
MRNPLLKLKTLAAGLLFAGAAFAGGGPTATVQVIHNCADPAADTVDVYLNGSLVGNDFAFRTATPFMQLPASVPLRIGIAPKNSSTEADTLKTFWFDSLAANETYSIIASGVVGSGFAANPDGRGINFDLKVFAGAHSTGSNGGLIDVNVFHGATDAPGVDVRVRSGGPLLVNNAKYGDITGYLTVPPTWYQLEVITEDSSAVVNTWIANLSGLGGRAATVIASGFLTPSTNNNGPAFGLFAVLDDGTVVALPVRETANVQLIHNSPDPAADSVDIYVNGQLGFPNLHFRNATPFIPITANYPIVVGIAPGNSTSWADTIKTWTYFFTPGTNYVAMATGVVGTGYAANPDGISTGLDVVVTSNAVISNGNPGQVSVAFAEGLSDIGAADFRIRSGGPVLVNNAKYKEVSSYLPFPAYYYAFEFSSGDSATLYDTWIANLSNYGGSGVFAFTSGFQNPANNNNGAGLKLFGALPSGQVVEFTRRQTATVQFVHNCADPAGASVDVYINGARYFNDFEFRNASPALGIMTADFPIQIAFAPGNSTSITDTFWSKTMFFSPGQIYVGIVQGLVGTGFAANPDGVNTAFDLKVKNPGQVSSTNPSHFQFFVDHGATDAPTVDVDVSGGSNLVNDAKYNDLTGYISVPADNYILDLKDGAGTTTLKRYVADLTSRAGQAGTILASGFLNPAANNNGEAFGLYLITSAGGPFIALPEYTAVNDLANEIGMRIYPNPSNGKLFLNFELKGTEKMGIDIIDLNGKVVQNIVNETLAAGKQTIAADLNSLSNGLYFVRVTNAGETSLTKFNLVR